MQAKYNYFGSKYKCLKKKKKSNIEFQFSVSLGGCLFRFMEITRHRKIFTKEYNKKSSLDFHIKEVKIGGPTSDGDKSLKHEKQMS